VTDGIDVAVAEIDDVPAANDPKLGAGDPDIRHRLKRDVQIRRELVSDGSDREPVAAGVVAHDGRTRFYFVPRA
jgi:hypothetical protein